MQIKSLTLVCVLALFTLALPFNSDARSMDSATVAPNCKIKVVMAENTNFFDPPTHEECHLQIDEVGTYDILVYGYFTHDNNGNLLNGCTREFVKEKKKEALNSPLCNGIPG